MTANKTDWRGIASRMRGDLDRADLTGRARRMAEFAIKATLMAGRTRVVIPNRMDLCRLLKIGKTHVAEVTAGLVSARILKVTEIADGWELLVFPDSSQWDVDWIYARDEMQRFLDYVNHAPGQCQGELIEPAPCLERTMAEVSADRVASSQNGNQRPHEVPKMGTPFKRLEVSNPKRAFSFETLKSGLLMIESGDERQAVAGCRMILGDAIADNDGGKWRVRWRSNQSKVKRVFAAAIEDMGSRKINHIGAHTEWLWKQFADK